MPTTPTEQPARNPVATRAVACFALVGTAAHVIAGVLHGSLTAGADQSSARTVFQHVLDTPAWASVNLVLLATLAWLAVFVGLDHAMAYRDAAAGWLGRLATVLLAVGIGVSGLLYLTDTVVLPELAGQWAQAGPAEQARLVSVGDAVQAVIRIPLFHSLPLFVFGLPFAVLGLAHAHRGGLLPGWLAWLTAATGSASFLIGVSWSLGSTAIPEVLFWAVLQPLLWVWGVVTGITLLRTGGLRQRRMDA